MLNAPLISSVTTGLSKYLTKNSIQEKDISFITPLLNILLMSFPLPMYKFIPAQLHRLTINEKVPPYVNDRISEMEYIKYPKAKYITKFGRCNIVANPILYGGFNLHAIFNEMKPNVGLNITTTEWKVKKMKPINFFPVFFITQYQNDPHNSLSLDIRELHENYTSEMPDIEKKGYDLAMEFFAKCFAKEVDESNHYDYYLSAYISKKIFDHPTLNYEGIVYPSVQSKLGVSNMAIRADVFDNKFEPVEVRHEINSILPKRSGINNVICRSDKFDEKKGIIIWEK